MNKTTIPAWGLSWILLGLSLYESTVETATLCLDRLSFAFDVIFNPRFYVFFKGYVQPLPFKLMQIFATGQSQPTVVYDADNHIFFKYDRSKPFNDIFAESVKRKHFSILSLEIIDSSKRAYYDLGDFVEKVKYVEGVDLNLSHLVMAWSISSNILPDTERFSLRYIDMNGDSFETLTLFESKDSLTVSVEAVD